MIRKLLACILVSFALGGLLAERVFADITIDLGRGPVVVRVPTTYDPNVPAPLIGVLHGYSSNGPEILNYLRLDPLSEQLGFIYFAPTGSQDLLGVTFWNATDACCNFFGSNIDDSGYIRDLIEEVRLQLNVNDRHIHLLGHSNGGFMAYRMACDHSHLIASVVSLAGATFNNPANCTPSEPVHTLQIHGTADSVIGYNGGALFGNVYPGALQTAETWVQYNGCNPGSDASSPNIDLDGSIPGAETSVLIWEDSCSSGGSTELWTIAGGSHTPILSSDFRPLVIGHVLDHPKPGQWTDLGQGLAGTYGVPIALGVGDLIPGSLTQFSVTGALELSPAALVIGLTQLSAPFAGGTLVPFPDSILVGFVTDAAGNLNLSSNWPSGLPSQFETYYQLWITDPVGPLGLSATNGLRSITP